MRWQCGLLTVPSRRASLLPATLASLRAGGFPGPRLFVDGCTHAEAASYEAEFGLPASARDPKLRVAKAWSLALYELFLRDPHADRFALFQDDLACCRNLRQYLEATAAQPSAYWCPYYFAYGRRPVNGQPARGWQRSSQRGLGALMLVFSRDGVCELLSEPSFVRRPLDEAGWRSVDGGVVTALGKQGTSEWVHYPSLVRHTGQTSTMHKGRNLTPEQDDSMSGRFRWGEKAGAGGGYPGDDFDALSLLADPPAPLPRPARIQGEMNPLLESLRDFLRPRPDCVVRSDDRTEVVAEWPGSGGYCRWFEAGGAVRVEWVPDASGRPNQQGA